MRVVFLHPDLGIGGAERLVVDAALALKSKGHYVQFVTSHHDPDHCFPETIDGTLSVTIAGRWFPRSIFGRCMALCAYIRMIIAAFYIVLSSQFAQSINNTIKDGADEGVGTVSPLVVFVDQVSACIPVLRLFSPYRVLFYCHFPDQLLTKRESWLKKAYRAPLDWFEEWSTGWAHCVLVNSNFTASVFRSTFKRLSNVPLTVLYPSINTTAFDQPPDAALVKELIPPHKEHVLLSINRYERKKNVALAIQALALLQHKLPDTTFKKIHLVISGGYDERVFENVNYHMELRGLVDNLGLNDYVTFVRSCPDDVKRSLLDQALVLLYTPANEHFGIVPIEAMYSGRPVIAVNSGGPLETVVDSETGRLVEPDSSAFADAIKQFVLSPWLAREYGIAARAHVQKSFSFESFTNKLNHIITQLVK